MKLFGQHQAQSSKFQLWFCQPRSPTVTVEPEPAGSDFLKMKLHLQHHQAYWMLNGSWCQWGVLITTLKQNQIQFCTAFYELWNFHYYQIIFIWIDIFKHWFSESFKHSSSRAHAGNEKNFKFLSYLHFSNAAKPLLCCTLPAIFVWDKTWGPDAPSTIMQVCLQQDPTAKELL